jgi:hypothetical protein
MPEHCIYCTKTGKLQYDVRRGQRGSLRLVRAGEKLISQMDQGIGAGESCIFRWPTIAFDGGIAPAGHFD